MAKKKCKVKVQLKGEFLWEVMSLEGELVSLYNSGGGKIFEAKQFEIDGDLNIGLLGRGHIMGSGYEINVTIDGKKYPSIKDKFDDKKLASLRTRITL